VLFVACRTVRQWTAAKLRIGMLQLVNERRIYATTVGLPFCVGTLLSFKAREDDEALLRWVAQPALGLCRPRHRL